MEVGSRPVEPSPAAGDEGLESVEMVGPRRGVTKSQDVVERVEYQHLQRGHQWKPLDYLGIFIGHTFEGPLRA